MDQQGNQFDSLRLTCSICLDLLHDPVTIPCGHSYCMRCIEIHWDNEDKKGIHSCPMCRKIFTPRPVLVKNILFAELVEDLKKSGLGTSRADLCYAGAEDVACDVCTERKVKAIKSCLVCVASYCEKHLERHYNVTPLKRHQLVEPSQRLQENVCSRHDEVMKIFCRSDQQCICYLCTMDEHRGHDTVPAAAERSEKQKKLAVDQKQIQQTIQEGEEKLKTLQLQTMGVNVSTDEALQSCKRIVSQLIHLIQERSSEVELQLRSQREDELNRIGGLQKKLQQAIAELKVQDDQTEQLAHTKDHNQFLRNYPSVSALSQSICPLPRIPSAGRHFEDVVAALIETSQKIQKILSEKETSIPRAVTRVGVSPLQEVEESRAGFLRYSCDLTMDPHTANEYLILSDGNRKVTLSSQKQVYSSNPSRFTNYSQVLSREQLSGRCYWEVEWEGYSVRVAVAYKNMNRSELPESFFGYNNKSWAFYSDTTRHEFQHNSKITKVSGPLSKRVGVFLDHSAGILSFYGISENTTLLHQIHTVFTQPLYAGIRLFGNDGDSAEFCQLK